MFKELWSRVESFRTRGNADTIEVLPAVPALWAKTGWALFYINTAVLFISLVLQADLLAYVANEFSGTQKTGSTTISWIPKFTFWYTTLLATGAVVASKLTHLAATGFTERRDTLTQFIIDQAAIEATKRISKYGITVRLDQLGGPHNQHYIRVYAKSNALPRPYYRIQTQDDWGLEFAFLEYFALLDAEKTKARTDAGSLAGALGAAVAAGILASMRLITIVGMIDK